MIDEITVRAARRTDASTVAKIHAGSWRRHYRGAFSDTYLDGDLDKERSQVWGQRLAKAGDDTVTFIAELADTPVGFIHVVLDADPTWGALVDNLHVIQGHQRAGIGTRLLQISSRTVNELRPASGLYLWVLEQNDAAQAFYVAMGGRFAGIEPQSPPGGDARNLASSPRKIRVVWPDAASLPARTNAPASE